MAQKYYTEVELFTLVLHYIYNTSLFLPDKLAKKTMNILPPSDQLFYNLKAYYRYYFTRQFTRATHCSLSRTKII